MPEIRSSESCLAQVERICKQYSQQDNNVENTMASLFQALCQTNMSRPFGSVSVSRGNASMFNSYRGDLASRALQVAYSQKGIRELTGRNDGAEIKKYLTGSASANHANSNTGGAAWCAGFASWSYKMANNGQDAPWGYQLSVSGIRSKAQQAGYYTKIEQTALKGGSYSPQAGDLLVLKRNGASHVAIVDKIENGKIITIEGNYKNQVSEVKRSINDREIDGFVRVSDWTSNRNFVAMS